MTGRVLSALLVVAMLCGCESYFNRSFVTADKAAPLADSSTPRPDLAALPPGAFCRVDLIRPPGRGQAYQGKIVRVEKDAIVLGNVISEGPMKRSRPPALKDLLSLRMPWSGGEETIDWQLLPDKELRIGNSEIAAAKVLDHDPIVDYYQR